MYFMFLAVHFPLLPSRKRREDFVNTQLDGEQTLVTVSFLKVTTRDAIELTFSSALSCLPFSTSPSEAMLMMTVRWTFGLHPS